MLIMDTTGAARSCYIDCRTCYSCVHVDRSCLRGPVES